MELQKSAMLYHIDRGYANIDQKLITLGAVIRRIKVDD